MDLRDEPCPECAERPCQCGLGSAEHGTLRLLPSLQEPADDEAQKSSGPRLVREFKGPTVEALRDGSRAREALPEVGGADDESRGRVVLGPGARAAQADSDAVVDRAFEMARSLRRRAVELARAVLGLADAPPADDNRGTS